MQIEMIKNFYPEYNEDNYVLWIIPNLFTESETTLINGNIEIIKGKEKVDIPIVCNTPYPNKKVYQLSLYEGCNICYGIPLIFNSFEELKEITEVNICWDIFTYDQLEDLDVYFRPYIISLQMHYEIMFSENGLNHQQKKFYTLFSKDTVHNGKKLAYETAYDHLDCINTTLNFEHGKWKVQEYIVDYRRQNSDDLVKEMMKNHLPCLSKDVCIDTITHMVDKCIDKYLTDYRFEIKEKVLDLKAGTSAEFIPDPAFGFHLSLSNVLKNPLL